MTDSHPRPLSEVDLEENLVLGMPCDNPDHDHLVVDDHPQDDLVLDDRCPQCGTVFVDYNECPNGHGEFHVHLSLEPAPPLPGKSGPVCPICEVGIDQLLICTSQNQFLVWPCQHGLAFEQVKALMES